MAKPRSQFTCQSCGYAAPKWLGRCPECQAWSSFVEEVETPPQAKGTRGARSSSSGGEARPLTALREGKEERIKLPLEELNRVLGGGLTKGSAVLLSGDPGIGKSTLLLQLLGKLAQEKQMKSLYVSGEESAAQLRIRAERLGVLEDSVYVLAETNVERVIDQIHALKPHLVVIDSVQTLYWPEIASIPGSVSQVREVADRLVRLAKESGIPVFLVGHVTKEGGIAGPMTLEHLVDTVLLIEGERTLSFRILRALKNRFGPTDELAVFEMREAGLDEVKNPSELFLRDRPRNSPGTVVFPAMEGSRPLLVEVQGLATKTSYGVPLRACVGFDKNRLTMLLAVLEKRAGLRLSDQDVYVNVVGGMRLSEPAADLAVVSAVVTSLLGKVFDTEAVTFGEVGLAGEIRAVTRSDLRLKEASKLGFTSAVVPPKTVSPGPKLACRAVGSVDRLVDLFS